MNEKHSTKISFHDSLTLSYDTRRYLHKCVSMAGTSLPHTYSMDTELQNCALPGTFSDQYVEQLWRSEVYYIRSKPSQIPYTRRTGWTEKLPEQN